MKTLKIVGGIILAIGFILSWYWFSWKLTLVLFLVLTGNNIEQSSKLITTITKLLKDYQDEMENILRRRN